MVLECLNIDQYDLINILKSMDYETPSRSFKKETTSLYRKIQTMHLKHRYIAANVFSNMHFGYNTTHMIGFYCKYKSRT